MTDFKADGCLFIVYGFLLEKKIGEAIKQPLHRVGLLPLVASHEKKLSWCRVPSAPKE